MKKAYLLFALSIILAQLVYSQHNPIYILYHKAVELKGKVKSCTTYNYVIPGSVDTKNKLWNAQPKKLLKNTITLYNPSGKVVEESNYFGNEFMDKHIFKYDSEGNLIEDVQYNENGISSLKSCFKYNSRGDKIEVEYYKENGILDSKRKYKYDSLGNLIEDILYNENGVMIRKSAYKYDMKGNIVEEINFDRDIINKLSKEYVVKNINPNNFQHMLTTKISYKYDARGNKTEESTFFPPDSFSNKLVYKYNLKGNPIEDIFYDSKGIVNWKRTYKYDSKGREIEYFSNQYGERRKEKYTLKYGLNGFPIERIDYQPDKFFNLIPYDKITYKYDSNGYPSGMNVYDSKGNLSSRVTNVYDDRGNLIETNEYVRISGIAFIKNKTTIYKLEYY